MTHNTPAPSAKCLVCGRDDGLHKMSCRPQNRADAAMERAAQAMFAARQPTEDREALAAHLVSLGLAEERPGYGHATGAQVADAVLAWFAARDGDAAATVHPGLGGEWNHQGSRASCRVCSPLASQPAPSAEDRAALALARAAVEGPEPGPHEVVPAAEYVRLARVALAARQPAQVDVEPVRYTPRGFAVWAEFVDLYDQTVLVTSSSLATEAAVWVQPADGQNVHLNVESATVLRNALDAWLSEVRHDG